MGVARTGRAEAVVAAPVEAVWRVVADPTRTGEWSHECRSVQWLGGATAAEPGARFRGRNRSGWMRWSRVCEVIAVEPGRELAWRTRGALDSTEWRITLEPAGGGTRIVQTFRVLSLPRWLDWLLSRLNPSHIDRSAALAADLERIGAVAAAGPAAQQQAS